MFATNVGNKKIEIKLTTNTTLKNMLIASDIIEPYIFPIMITTSHF